MAKQTEQKNTQVPIEDFVVTEIDLSTMARRGRSSKYNFGDLEPGKGFYFPLESIKAIQAAASNFSSTHRDYKFTVRTVDETRGAVVRLSQLEKKAA